MLDIQFLHVEVIFIYASTDSKPNVHVQDDSLQWKEVEYGIHADLKFKCVDLCLWTKIYKNLNAISNHFYI